MSGPLILLSLLVAPKLDMPENRNQNHFQWLIADARAKEVHPPLQSMPAGWT